MTGMINKKIEDHFLKNFYGFEIQIAPYIFAHLKLSAVLEEYGYQIKDTDRAQIYLTNTLEPSETRGLLPFMKELNEENHIANIVKSEKNILVIMGNPPWFYLSANNNSWIQDLLKNGYVASDGKKNDGYYYVDGKPIGEKNPKMLQDDYVKFIRFAQWKIDLSGEGVVSYITNHSYLDNITFRGMRQSLLKTFNRIYILNLHGDMRKKEKTPKGEKDENVFESITQGTAILICVKSKTYNDHKIFYDDFWGKRFDKYALLDRHIIFNSDGENVKGKEIEWQELTPKSPNYFFVRKDRSHESSYEKFWSVNDMFEIKSTTIQTARDKLTIQFSPEEVHKTIKKFTELDKNSIMNEFKIKDSVDWTVDKAKKDLVDSGLDDSKIIPILYRPFDVRYTYYTGKSGGFMGRPRYAVMQHMLHENLALITRRVMQKPFNFSFVTDKIFAHGTIASDNKGIEYAFPLYQYDLITSEKKSNLTSKLFSYLEKLYEKPVDSEHIFYYVYAVLYSKNYRKKFATFLAEDFPKIPFTKNFKVFEKMSNLGKELVSLHTNKIKLTPKTKFNISGSNKVERIKFEDGKIFINDLQFFEVISEDIWNFSIGSYSVLKKWLEGKENKILENKDIEQFLQLPEILQKTISCMDEIDKIISTKI
jgi:predicted helicase